MSEVEKDRLALHQKARDCFGEREGDILMEHLPPAGWSHLATKDDVALSGALLRTELADLRTEMEKGFRNQAWKIMTAIGTSQTLTVTVVGFMLHYMR